MSNFKKSLIAMAIAFSPVLAANAASTNGMKVTEADTVITNNFRATSLEIQKGSELFRLNTIADTPLPIIYPDPNKSSAITPETVNTFKQINGVYIYPRDALVALAPFDVINIRGYYPDPTTVDYEVSRVAAEKGAYAYQINSIADINNSSNAEVIVSLYTKDAPFLYVYKANFYHIGDKSVQELPGYVADQYVPTGSFVFKGQYQLSQDISAHAARHAIDRGARGFFIKSITENNHGTRLTVAVDYF